jgi:hypothetical protein
MPFVCPASNTLLQTATRNTLPETHCFKHHQKIADNAFCMHQRISQQLPETHCFKHQKLHRNTLVHYQKQLHRTATPETTQKHTGSLPETSLVHYTEQLPETTHFWFTTHYSFKLKSHIPVSVHRTATRNYTFLVHYTLQLQTEITYRFLVH